MRNKDDLEMTPRLRDYLEKRQHRFETDSRVEWDGWVDGNSEEWKFLRGVYTDFYFELFQCADPGHCPDCIEKGNTSIMLGWAHRQSYCKADIIRLVWGNPEIKRTGYVSRIAALNWLWDVYLPSKTIYYKAMANWDGQHRTLGVAVPFDKIPAGMLYVE